MWIKIVIGVVVLVLVGVVAFVLLGSDDDEPKSAQKSGGKSSSSSSSSKDKDDSGSDSEPALHTVVVKRARGKNAIVNAGKFIRNPDEIWIRVSAAPKQETRITWLLACGGKSSNQDNYLATPPHLLQLKVPSKAKACAASVGAQLAKVGAKGRVKVAVLVNR